MRLAASAAALGLAVLASGSARAEDEAAVWALRAKSLAHAGRCQDARSILERGDAVRSAEAWLLVGRCHLAVEDFAASISGLERALELDPELAAAWLELGIARYHTQEGELASEALERARVGGVRSSQLHLYAGLLALSEGRHPRAADEFASARERGEAPFAALAAYYEAIALERAHDFEGARRAYAAAAGDGARGPLRDEARRGLDRVGTRRPGRSWLTATAGLEYDDNVVLRGVGVELPREIADENDARLVWAAEAGVELFRGPSWGGGALAYYYGSAHDDQDDFDVQAPNLGLWLDHGLSEVTTTRLRYDFGYVWLEGDSFVSTQVLSGSLQRDWGRSGRTRVRTQLYAYDYRYPIPLLPDVPGVNEKSVRDRDGNGVAFGLEHTIPLGLADAELRLGYDFGSYFARGDDYDHQRHDARVGASWLLPFETRVDLEAGYAYRPYRDPSSYPDPDRGAPDGDSRRDRVLHFHASLERELRPGISVALRYRGLDHDSSAEVFDYERRVVGLYFTVHTEP